MFLFVFVDEVPKIDILVHGPCLCEHDSCLYGELASAPWHDDLGEDPWFPFVTNALNAKELYIKDKALFKGPVTVKQWAISFKRKYGIWVWNPSFCPSTFVLISSLSKISFGDPTVLVRKSSDFFDSGSENPFSNLHSSHSQKMDWKTKGSWILFLGALKGQNLANSYLVVAVRFNKLYHVFLYDLL